MFGKSENKKPDLEIFTIRDNKVQNYEAPFYAVNQFEIIRDIQNMFRDPEARRKNKHCLNPEDYSLFRLGFYDKGNASITLCTKEHIVDLIDLMPQEKTGPSGIVPT